MLTAWHPFLLCVPSAVVLGQLYEMVKAFVVQACVAKGLPESQAAQLGGKIFTYGSYRLGVHNAGTWRCCCST